MPCLVRSNLGQCFQPKDPQFEIRPFSSAEETEIPGAFLRLPGFHGLWDVAGGDKSIEVAE
jgi:hypothetical protein